MLRLSPYWLWVLLALPAFGFSIQLATSQDPRVIQQLLHPTGEFSARFMIITMLASPLVLLLRGWRGPQWLKKNRRYFGVAAFGYAAMHTILYLVDQNSVASVLADLPKLYIWTGWIAFVIFIPLAATSMDYFVRRMGPANWKRLQRWTYAAAVLTLHSLGIVARLGGDWPRPWCILAHLGCWKGYRVWYWYLRPRPQRTA